MCEVLGKEKEKKKPSKVIWRGRMVFKAILVQLWFSKLFWEGDLESGLEGIGGIR